MGIPSGAPGLHALLHYFGINFRFDHTYTNTFNCFLELISRVQWEMCKGNLYLCSPAPTYTPEITLMLLNCFRINFPNIRLTLTL